MQVKYQHILQQKLQAGHGLIYHYLEKQYGLEYAKKYFQANEEAIKEIEKNIIENEINCDFQKENNYIYTTNLKEKEKIQEEMKTVSKIFPEAEEVKKIELPFEIVSAIKFPNQAQMNPVKYMKSLAKKVVENKGKIYCNTTCIKIEKENGKTLHFCSYYLSILSTDR